MAEYRKMSKEEKVMLAEMSAHRQAMNMAWTEDEAFDEYCACCDIRQKLFSGECAMRDCDTCPLTRKYNDVARAIRQRPQNNVTFNLFGCDVTINVKEVR